MFDLISRDKLIINMNDAKAIAMHMFQFPKNQINVAEAVADAMIYNVRKAPAVDSVPVVHGKWHHDITGANFCSRCMKYAYEDGEYHMIWHTQYCPHCGAKMDEEGYQDDD